MLRDIAYKLSDYVEGAWYLPKEEAPELARWLLVRFVVMLTVVIGSAVVYMIVQAWDRNDEVAIQLAAGLFMVYFLAFAGYFILGTLKFANGFYRAIRHSSRRFD
jgi:hypothetical protein